MEQTLVSRIINGMTQAVVRTGESGEMKVTVQPKTDTKTLNAKKV